MTLKRRPWNNGGLSSLRCPTATPKVPLQHSKAPTILNPTSTTQRLLKSCFDYSRPALWLLVDGDGILLVDSYARLVPSRYGQRITSAIRLRGGSTSETSIRSFGSQRSFAGTMA